MLTTHTELQNFRNHGDTSVEWGSRMNVITGHNGAGKTNLIDAIHYLCMSRSFVASSDRYVVQQDAPYFMVKGQFEGNVRAQFSVSCSYARADGKQIFVNDSPLDRISDLIGMVPVVVLAPEDKKLTAEGPSERRSFLDSLISQISPGYLKNLLNFRKARKQRNKLLQQYNGSRATMQQYLAPWDDQLITHGAHIVARRTQVLQQFKKQLSEQYQTISGMKHKPDLQYQTFCEPDTDEEIIAERYRQALEEALDNELEREVTTVGPHRDEIVFYLDDFELRKFGSQGQHRLFALSLKMAQLFFFTEKLDDTPLFLLDDVFGDLDPQRTEVLLKALIDHAGQTFITSANALPFDSLITFDGDQNRAFTVENGTVNPAT